MEHLKASGIGVDGQCTKLEYFTLVINFLENNDVIINDRKLMAVKEKIKMWKKVLRREKNKKNVA